LIKARTEIDKNEELYMAYGSKYWLSSKWPLGVFQAARDNYQNDDNKIEWANIRKEYN
jgi:hypothetical protein